VRTTMLNHFPFINAPELPTPEPAELLDRSKPRQRATGEVWGQFSQCRGKKQ